MAKKPTQEPKDGQAQSMQEPPQKKPQKAVLRKFLKFQGVKQK